MPKITQADMQPADIIVSTGSGAVSAVIRTGSLSPYSHAALYIGNGEVIEAIGEGVVRQSLANALSDDTLAVVYRRIGLSAAQAGLVIRYAAQMTRDVTVDDALFGALRQHFDTTQIVELTSAIATYNMVARFLVALGVSPET